MQKFLTGGGKEWLLIAVGAALLLAALFLPLKFALAHELTTEEEQLLNAYRHNEIIRIHVIANSDSPADQEVKLKVRDALIEAFGGLLIEAGETSSGAVYQLLQENIHLMQQTAQTCAVQNGFSGNVYAEAGILSLAEKQYGSVMLPAGEYRALRITLGEGNGQNWWCVLYPQLCLALSETDMQAESTLFWSSERILHHWLLTGI